MPPKNKNYLEPLVWRNKTREFARSSEISISQCRQCVWKVLCLENEKNPVIRHLVLGEPMPKDDLFNEEDYANSKRDCQM